MTSIRRGIGLFGGTFDPIHNGHLSVARHALDTLNLARLDFVLAPSPWQKTTITPVEQRMRLIEDAIAGIGMMHLNTLEVMRQGPTYTIDTLREMRAQVGPTVPLVLIMGADQWKNFHTWKDWELYPEYVNIALCNREKKQPKADAAVSAMWLPREVAPSELNQYAAGKIARFSIPSHCASSTKIREIFTQMPKDEAFFALENWLPVRVAKTIARDNIY